MAKFKYAYACKYSPSCFECPLNDCRATANIAQLNALPEDENILHELSDEAQRERYKDCCAEENEYEY